ncbi:hypothetical protein CASFOL_005797 [Castilleja foliolosa]|uniref:TF-B3 domain-containing protein n=1 Tax=Castilleja foliolosa TaxID=1961234 RepID=A0ABD3E5I2_9LAMI
MATPKFCKIILDPNADTMRIPPEFMKKHGQNLPSPVFLKAPFGTAMEVQLVQSNGTTMFQRGWIEFKKRYSIAFGHFLVFEYNGKSGFNVAIYDKSGVEIKYSSCDDYNRAKCKPENRGVNYRTEIDTTLIEESSSGESSDENQCSDYIVATKRTVASKTSMAYQKALDFVSGHHAPNNPFFIRLMGKSYISGMFILHLPMAFAKRTLPCKGANSIIMVKDGKRWPVRCYLGNEHADLNRGWKEFVQDNGLKLGDSCVFEVANRSNKLVWNVVIFRSD